MKTLEFRLIFTEVRSQWSNYQHSRIDSDNGVAPNRRSILAVFHSGILSRFRDTGIIVMSQCSPGLTKKDAVTMTCYWASHRGWFKAISVQFRVCTHPNLHEFGKLCGTMIEYKLIHGFSVKVASPVTRQSHHTPRLRLGVWWNCRITADATLTSIPLTIPITGASFTYMNKLYSHYRHIIMRLVNCNNNFLIDFQTATAATLKFEVR